MTVPLQEILKHTTLDKWQTSKQCLRSIYNDPSKHQSRLQVDRKLKADELRTRETQRKALIAAKKESEEKALRAL